MAVVHSLAKLVKFARRTEWSEALAEVTEQHLGRACSNLGIVPDEIFDVLGEVPGNIVHGCALEDFMARDYEGRNVVDEYLKRRGYVESAGAKRYMQSFRHSVMSLYEVNDIAPGRSFNARDLIRSFAPVQVFEVTGTKALAPGDHIGARLIKVGTDWHMGGGVLRYNRRASDFLIDMLKGLDTKLPDNFRALAETTIGSAGVAAIEQDLAEKKPPLAIMAPTFTGIWLAEAIEYALSARRLGDHVELRRA